MEGGKLDCYISYTTGQTNNNTGDITTDEANNSGDLGLPCALREIDIDGGFKECHIPLEFSDCLLGNYLDDPPACFMLFMTRCPPHRGHQWTGRRPVLPHQQESGVLRHLRQ